MQRKAIVWIGTVALAATLGCAESPAEPSPPVGVAVTNAAPSVTVSFQGAAMCRPQAGQPCTLDVVAQAVDPDADPLTYEWSGCASGTLARATCVVERAGPVTATVIVSDGHDHRVSAGATGEGLPLENRPPTVAADFERTASCTPEPGRPCTLDLLAVATDPDGDPLMFEWSGCASGSSPRASCQVSRPGPVYVTLRVSDTHGHVVTRELAGSGDGVNRPPGVQIGYVTAFPGSFELLGNVMDPDDGFLCGRQYCVSAVGSGACSGGSLDCTCLAGLEANVLRNGTGTCTVTFTLKDKWEEIGTPTYSFAVTAPAQPAAGDLFAVLIAPFFPQGRR
jgi:hypothetical protein